MSITLLQAISEYNSENEDGQHKIIYSYFGLLIYQIQCLEETMSIMLWTNKIFKKKQKNKTDLRKIIDKIEKSEKTLGNFINEISQNYNLPEKVSSDLKIILDKRNFIVHSYFKVEIHKMISDLGRREILEYFCNTIDDIRLMDNHLKKYYTKYTDALGLTKEKIESIIEEIRKEELLREKTVANNGYK